MRTEETKVTEIKIMIRKTKIEKVDKKIENRISGKD